VRHAREIGAVIEQQIGQPVLKARARGHRK
jgi:hypothetical protein